MALVHNHKIALSRVYLQALKKPTTRAIARRASVDHRNLTDDSRGVSVLHGILKLLHHIYQLEDGSSLLHQHRHDEPATAGSPHAESDGFSHFNNSDLIADHLAFFYRAETLDVLVEFISPFLIGPATSADQRVLVARIIAALDHLLQIRAHNLDHQDEIYNACWWAIQENVASQKQVSSEDSESEDDEDDDTEDEDDEDDNPNDTSVSSAMSPRRVLAHLEVPGAFYVFEKLLHDPAAAATAPSSSSSGLHSVSLEALWKVVELGLDETILDENGIEVDIVGQKAWLILARQALAIQTVKLADDELPNLSLLRKIAELCLSEDSDVVYVAVEVAVLVISQRGLTAESSQPSQTPPPGMPDVPAAPSNALAIFCGDNVFSTFAQGLLRVLNDQRYPFRRGTASQATIVRLIQILSFLCTSGSAGARLKSWLAEHPVVSEVGDFHLIPDLYSNDRKVLLEIIVREAGNLPESSQVLFFYIQMADTMLTAYHDDIVKDCKQFFDALREMLVAGARGISVPAATLKLADKVLIDHDTLEYEDEDEDDSDDE